MIPAHAEAERNTRSAAVRNNTGTNNKEHKGELILQSIFSSLFCVQNKNMISYTYD